MNNYTIVLTKGEYSLLYSQIDSIQVATKVITNISNNQNNENSYIIKNYATIDGQIKQYLEVIQFIETNLQTSNVEIKKTDNGQSDAMILAYLLFKQYPMQAALEVLNVLGINHPPDRYKISLEKLYSIIILENQDLKLRKNPQYLNEENIQSIIQRDQYNVKDVLKNYDDAQSKSFEKSAQIKITQIYQNRNKSFYYVQDPIHQTQDALQLKPINFGFFTQTNYENIYRQSNQYIDSNIEQYNIQINQDPNQLCNAIIFAFLLYKGFDFELAMIAMNELEVPHPPVTYLISLKNYEQEMIKLNKSQITFRDSSILEESQLANSIIQSEIYNFPVFSQRLIETQRCSQILGSEYQVQSEIFVESKIFSEQQPSQITFGGNQGNSIIISEESRINKINSSIAHLKK